MGKFDDFIKESNENWIARARRNIDNLPRTPDTRTASEIAKYEAGLAESKKWAKDRAIAQEKHAREVVESMSPEEKQLFRDRYKVTNPHP
tara:strand:- start:368 stop:637 length:270 start_codon:yes stop_codon:yes gene_type:complete